MPPCASHSDTEQRTFQLLGPLGEEPIVWAECLFADPVGDIAVLGSPDNQSRPSQADSYDELTQTAVPLSIAHAPENGRAWLLSLAGQWFPCTAEHYGGPLWLFRAAEGIVGGMSGSPIVADNGSAIGVLVNSAKITRDRGQLNYSLKL